jgi:phosphoglycolate phosphatase
MLVIFDFDGTLADSWPVAADELVAAAATFGYRQLTRSQVESLRGLPTREVFKELGISRWRIPKIAAHLRCRFERSAAQIKLFNGIPEMLGALTEAKILTGVVSSNSQATIATVLGTANMRHVAQMECGASVFGKSRLFRRMMRKMGAAPSVTIAVGDETRDLDAAAKAGILGLGVEWGCARPELLRSMAQGRTFRTVEELTSALIDRARGLRSTEGGEQTISSASHR